MRNIDTATVNGFGEEWAAFDQTAMTDAEWQHHFDGYFSLLDFETLRPDAVGFDLGCGSGRWAAGVAPKVGTLHCIDPAEAALAVAKRRLASEGNVQFHLADAGSIPLHDSSQDFGYSLGVLHHIPDTAKALKDAVGKLKPGAPFLVYLYYAFDQRPAWFRAAWKSSDLLRRGISKLPIAPRKAITSVIAATVYWPAAKVSRIIESLGGSVDVMPLSSYRKYSFYTMRTDALDRFGTRLEQRFTKAQIRDMMEAAGLENVRFRDGVPYWVSIGTKAALV